MALENCSSKSLRQKSSSDTSDVHSGAKIQGRTAIITGGSQGIGKELAKKFAEAGFNVVIAARQADRLYAVADDLAKIVSRKGGVMAIPTDITKYDDVAALVKQVLAHFEDVDVLCNNAGICLKGTFALTTAEDFRSQIETNYLGGVMVTSAFMPAMKHTSRGRKHTERPVVAMINSHASRMALPNMAAYSASKAALASFADAIRPELASNGIHVVQIHPGVVNSDFLERAQWRVDKTQEAVIKANYVKMMECSPVTQSTEQVASVAFNAIMKYTREVTVGFVFKASLAAHHWCGVDPLTMTHPHWLAMNAETEFKKSSQY